MLVVLTVSQVFQLSPNHNIWKNPSNKLIYIFILVACFIRPRRYGGIEGCFIILSMKNIFILYVLLLISGFVSAQSNREDIEINLPKADGWQLDELSSIPTDFAHRFKKWDIKHDKNESWQKVIFISNDDITQTSISLDSISVLLGSSNEQGAIINLLKEKKETPYPYKLISMENRKIKSELTTISTLIYLADGKTCRHSILVSVRTPKFSAEFLKQWSEILLHSRIVPSQSGNFERTDDAYVEAEGADEANTVYVTANFKKDQLKYLMKGQPARIILDAFPDASFSGKISKIGNLKNNGAHMPGNFVKIVERAPVNIKVEVPDTMRGKFKHGMSSTVTITTAP